MRVLILRPEPQASLLARDLRQRGIDALIAPMLGIEPLPGIASKILTLQGGLPQGLIFTSAHAIPPLFTEGSRLELLTIPAVAVGPATAAAARAAGFVTVIEAGGNAEAVITTVLQRFGAGAHLLHIAGRDRTGAIAERLNAAGRKVQAIEAYEAHMQPVLSEAARVALQTGAVDVVVVGSARTATAFRRCLEEEKLLESLAFSPLLFALSEAAAAPLKDLFSLIRIAEKPDGAGLREGVVALSAALANNGALRRRT